MNDVSNGGEVPATPSTLDVMREDQRYHVALLLFAADAIMTDDQAQPEAALEWARRMWLSLDDDEWGDGRHEGDCTKKPFTCHRCLVEDYYERAQRLWDADE